MTATSSSSVRPLPCPICRVEELTPALTSKPSVDSIPLSHKPSIEALSLAKPILASHYVKTYDASYDDHDEVQEIIRRTPSSKFVYKTPSHIIFERDLFPFKTVDLPTIAVQAPTPQRNVSAVSTAPAPSFNPLKPWSADSFTEKRATRVSAPLPFPLVPQPHRHWQPQPQHTQVQTQIIRPPSPATTTHSTCSTTPSLSSTVVPTSQSSQSSHASSSNCTPTPRELAERSERVQTLSDSVMRSRAYSALMNRHCETLTVALDTAAELQAAKDEIRRLRAKVARYKEVNRTLVHWGQTLRDENEVLRAEAGDSPGMSLFEPERDMRSGDEEEAGLVVEREEEYDAECGEGEGGYEGTWGPRYGEMLWGIEEER